MIQNRNKPAMFKHNVYVKMDFQYFFSILIACLYSNIDNFSSYSKPCLTVMVVLDTDESIFICCDKIFEDCDINSLHAFFLSSFQEKGLDKIDILVYQIIIFTKSVKIL